MVSRSSSIWITVVSGRRGATCRLARVGIRASVAEPLYRTGRYSVNVLPTAGRAAQLNLAAEQAGELAADRQAEPRAAVLAARAGVGLLERFEDDPLLVGGDADPAVGHGKRHDRRRLAEHRVIRGPAGRRRRHLEPHEPVRRELEGVRQQVLEDLLQPLRIGEQAPAEARIDLHVEPEAAALRFVPERPAHHVDEVRQEDLLRVDADDARFDLREVEDVADEVQQVGAGAMNRARELDLARRQVALRVVGELLTEDQDAVERRPQLVRHVGEELGLVLRRQRQLRRLLLERAARLLDLGVLALDFDVLLGELLRLQRQLIVRLLQLVLLRLQLAGELLRLLEQPFGLHRRFDRVEQDADVRHQLVEEREVRTRRSR